MLLSVTLDDSNGTPVTLHETSKRALTAASGLVGISSLRDSRRARPQAHGAIDETRWEDGKLIALDGEIMSSVSIADAFAEFRAVMAPMLQTLDKGPALLKWTEGANGLALQRLVRLASDVDPPLQEGAAILHYQAQFFAEDPRAYSQTQTVAPSTPLSSASGGRVFPTTYPYTYATSGGGTVAFVNSGNRSTPPIFWVYGRAVNPQVVLLDTGQRISLKGTIAGGDYLEVNVAKRTIKLNGATSRLNFLDAANSQWMEAPAGTSNWQMVAADFDSGASVAVVGRSAYA